ncbi:MAG: GTPase protein [Roseomonas sp.]|nr:GTPase protein [Roseomonas sp.]
MGWSAAAGLAPIPLLDLAAISAVQVRMLKKLADHYQVPFTKDLAKSLIGAAIGGSSAFMVAMPLASMLKAVPIIGTFVSTFVTPAAAAATTFALGKVFIQHFEAGGTMLDMEPEALRQHFYDEYKRNQAPADVETPLAA